MDYPEEGQEQEEFEDSGNDKKLNELLEKYNFASIDTWSVFDKDIDNINDMVDYLEKVCALLHHFDESLKGNLSVKILPTKQPQLKVLAMAGDWQHFVLKSLLSEQSGVKKIPCIPHLVNGEHKTKVQKMLQVMESLKLPSVKDGNLSEELNGKVKELKEKLEKQRKSAAEEYEKCQREEQKNYELSKELSKLRMAKKVIVSENEVFMKRKDEIISILKGLRTMKNVNFEEETDEETHERLKNLIRNVDEYIVQIGDFTMQDYMEQLGDDFEPICGLMYKLKKRDGDLAKVKENLKLMMNDSYQVDVNDVLSHILKTEDHLKILLKRIKGKVKEKGMFYQKIGKKTVTIGITNDILMDLQSKKELIKENEKQIKDLQNKIQELKKGFTEKKEEKLKKWLHEGAESQILDMASYLKNKAYRKPVVKELFGKSEYKSGMKYCGVRITAWEFDYLEKKSLSSVLNKRPEELKTITEMKYSIKCLNALLKIKDVRKAMVWLRNYYARKLGRKQAGRHGWLDQHEQDIRFYNTYVFEENYTLDEFLSMSPHERTLKFMKQYKQLDREVNSNYMCRFYSRKEMKKSYDSHRHQKILKSLASLVYKNETIGLRTTIRKVANKRNPLAASRKIAQTVNEKFRQTLARQDREELITILEKEIPRITYDHSGKRESIKYQRHVEKFLENRSPFGSDYMDKISKAMLDELKGNIRERKAGTDDKGKDDESFTYSYSDEDRYESDFDSYDYESDF